MKFSCPSCQAKYTIADDRVGNKAVRLTCQKCAAEIVVRGPAPDTAATQKLETIFGNDDDEEDPGASTRIANLSELEGMRQRALQEKEAERQKPRRPEASASLDENARVWMTLVQGDQRGPFSAAEVLVQSRTGVLNERSYVWKEGMKEWAKLGSVAPFKAHFAHASAPAPRVPKSESETVIVSRGSLSPKQAPKDDDLDRTRAMQVDEIGVLFKSKDKGRANEPPLSGPHDDVDMDPQIIDGEPSGPKDIGDETEQLEQPSSGIMRSPTGMFMRQMWHDARHRKQRGLLIAIATVLGSGMFLLLLGVVGVIELPGLGTAYDLVGADSASKPASQPAAVMSEDDKRRIREQLMGKPKASASSSAGLKSDQITEVVSANARGVKACYEKELERKPELRGKLVVSFSIDNDGSVSRADITTPELKNTELARCVAALVRAWKFPSFTGDAVSVAYPFLLSPTE